jgi:tetratricopeptide (TPR) repeat protein
MEIHVRLAGVQLGPYSEKQVRDYLAEGLLSPTDSARAEGAEHWIAVTELLDKLASPSDTSRIPEAGERPESDKPKRAPDAPPGVTHFPSKFSDSKELTTPMSMGALSKKTIPIGPTAPSTLTPATTSPSASQMATSPLTGTRQSTKKVTRAGLVKALVQKTSPLPTKSLLPPVKSSPGPVVHEDTIQSPIRAPESVPLPEKNDSTPSPSEAKEGTSIPALVKALTAKTVPMRSSAAPPVTQKATPFTAPLPTKSMFKPSSGKIAPPETPTEPMARPGAMVEPDPIPSPIRSKLPDADKTPQPGSARLPQLGKKPASATLPAAEEEEVAAPYNPPPTEKKKKPSRPLRLFPILIAACALLAIATIYYVWSPYHAVSNFRKALSGGAPADLDATIDFPSVRDSLKGEVQKQLPSTTEAKSSPVKAAMGDAAAMIDQSIDVYLKPDTLAALAKSDLASLGDTSKSISPDAAAKILGALGSQPVKTEGLASLDDFVVDLDLARLHFRMSGLGWKLETVALQAPSSADSAASPLLVPVVSTYLGRGNDLLKKNDWDGAIAAFTQIIAINPKSSAAFAARASALQSKGDLNGALADFTQAVTLDPNAAQAYNDRGNVKAAKNDLEGAIADFTQAIHIDPTLAAAFDSRGNARTAKDDLDGAIADYTEAITLDPKNASAFSDRGFARQANGNLDGAIADYTQALAIKPKTSVAYYNRGLARQSQGNLEAAIVDYDRALAFDPKIAGAYYYRGNAKNSLHDLDGAIADYTQAIALNPKIAMAYCYRGLARQSKNDLDGALADYTQALAVDPKIALAYFNRGLIKAQRNDLDGAIADSTHALDLDPKNAQAYYNRGFAKLTKGNLDGALADLKEFCDLAPTDRYADHARLYLWLISKAQNTKSDPDQDLSDALQSDWNSSGDDMATKAAAFLLGRLNEVDFLASASSPDAKTDQGQHCEAYYFAGMKRLLMGDKVTATDYFKKCIATGQSDFCEYVLARAELRALEPVTLPAPMATPTEPAPPATPLSPSGIPEPPLAPPVAPQ